MKYADKQTHFTHMRAVSLEEIHDFHALKTVANSPSDLAG